MFTHLVSDAGLFNYPPSACHLEQQAVQIKPNGCAHPRRGGWKGILAFFFFKKTSLLAASFLVCQQAKESPPTKSSYVGRHQNRESLFFAPRAEPPQHFAPSNTPKMMGLSSKPLRSLGPDVQSSYHSLLRLLPLSLPPFSILASRSGPPLLPS